MDSVWLIWELAGAKWLIGTRMKHYRGNGSGGGYEFGIGYGYGYGEGKGGFCGDGRRFEYQHLY